MGRPREIHNILVHALSFFETRVLALVWVGSMAALFVAHPPPGRGFSYGCAGAAAWILLEYLLHRFVLHLPRPRTRLARRLHARLHWKHHLEPQDPRLLFIPVWASAGILGIGAAAGAAVGGLVGAAGVVAGLSTMLIVYETTHLAAHVSYRPRTRYGAFLKRFHLLHHFRNEHYWYGVTHPLLDWVFGTWRAPESTARSDTTRTLGFDTQDV